MSSGEEINPPSGGLILKIKSRKSFSQLVEYCASHATSMNAKAMREPIYSNMASKTTRDLSREVAFCFRQRQNKKVNTGHLIISPSTPFRSEEDLRRAIDVALEFHGLAETPWAAFYHGEKRESHPHCHIAFSLIRWDGSAVNMDHSYRRNEAAARVIEKEFSYLGELTARPRRERPRNNDSAHKAMRRERRIQKRKEKENGRQQRYFEHTPGPDEPHPCKPGKLSENHLHALSERRVAHHGIPESQGVLQADALPGGRKPDRVRWQSGNSNELIAINSKKGSKANMTAQAKIKDLETQVRAALARDDVTDLDGFQEAVREETGGAADVEFWRGPAGDVAGWSLVLVGGTKVKGSELARSLSFKHLYAALEANRRRRMAGRQAQATAQAIASTSEVLAAPQAVPAAAAGNVVSLRPGAHQPGAIVTRSRPAPGQKPELFAIQDPGCRMPGYDVTRVDAEGGDSRWEYRRRGADEVVFTDEGDALELSAAEVANQNSVDAFVLLAKQRFGTHVTLTQVPADPQFLTLLAQAAERRGVTVVDDRTGLPLPATHQHKEPAPAPALDFLNFKPDEPVSVSPAPAPGDQSQPLAPDRSDLAARRRAAADVAALVTREVTGPGPALGTMPRDVSKVSSVALRAQLDRAQAFLPVQAWVEQVGTWHRAEHEALGDRTLSPDEFVLREAEISGDRLAAAACKAAQDRAHAGACLFLARQERDARSAVQRGAELLSGKGREREAEISRLEAVEKDAKAAERRTRREFFSQQEVQQKVDETAELRETHRAELSAVAGVAGILKILAELVRKLAAMVAQAVAHETQQERDRARDVELREHLERLAAGEPEAVERQRREQQHRGQHKSIVVDRERGRG